MFTKNHYPKLYLIFSLIAIILIIIADILLFMKLVNVYIEGDLLLGIYFGRIGLFIIFAISNFFFAIYFLFKRYNYSLLFLPILLVLYSAFIALTSESSSDLLYIEFFLDMIILIYILYIFVKR